MSNGMSSGFLKFNSLPPRVHVTGDSEKPDASLVQHLQEEGFDVTYLPLQGGGKQYGDKLRNLANDLELGESYSIISYGTAAAACLEFHVKPQRHLAALIAYYPTVINRPQTKYPPDLKVLCHLADSQRLAPVFPSYTYEDVKPGFAETGKKEFNRIAASLAWSRTLGVLRRAFKIDSDLETVLEEHRALKYTTKDPVKTVNTMIQNSATEKAHVNHVPTLTGAIGQKDLFVFYRDYFIAKSPPSLRVKLVSRTIGVDRVVDEMVISFKHTQEVPWMLPGVPATNKTVDVALVSIVCIRGGKLCHEHIYWDQASVLVQVGLLDPNLVPGPMKRQGLKRLPVYGTEVAAKVLDEDSQPSNDLIASWKQRPKGDPGVQRRKPKQPVNGTGVPKS